METILSGPGVLWKTEKDKINNNFAELRNTTSEVVTPGMFGTGSAAFLSALQVANETGKRIYLSGEYVLESSISIELIKTLCIECSKVSSLTVADGASLSIKGKTILTTRLSVDAPLHSLSIVVDEAVGVQPGDIVYISNNTVAETGWNTKKKFTSTVASVDGGNVIVNNKLHFPFSSSEDGNVVVFYRPQKIYINGLHLITQTLTNSSGVELAYLTVNIENHRQTNSDNAYGVYLNKCVNSTIEKVYVKNGTYPFLVNTGRNIKFKNLYNDGAPIRHIVAPAAWSADIYIDGVYGPGGLIESHPAFNVNYENADIVSYPGMGWNLRSIGGSVKNSRIRHIGEPPSDMLVQRLGLTDVTLWGHSVFVMDNVEVGAVTDSGLFPILYGHDITIKDCIFPDGTVIATGTAAFNDGTTDRLYLYNNKGISHIYNRSTTHKVYSDKKEEKAVLRDGFYEISSWLNTVVRDDATKDARWSNSGTVVTQVSGADPIVIPVKVFSQTRQGVFGFQQTYMVIKLTALVKHANVGGIDIQENIYHAHINNSGISSVTLTGIPSSESGNTGIENESLAITVGNVTYSGDTQDTENLTQFIAFDVTLTSGRTSPIYSLFYSIYYYGVRI